jgi:hypothetical protein
MQNFSFVSLSSRSVAQNPGATRFLWSPILRPPEKILTQKTFRGPHLTSLNCVPNFKIISRLEVPQVEEPNDSPYLDMSGFSPFFPLLRPNVLVQRSIKFFEMRLRNMWMSPNRELKTELFLGNVKSKLK